MVAVWDDIVTYLSSWNKFFKKIQYKSYISNRGCVVLFDVIVIPLCKSYNLYLEEHCLSIFF